METKGLVVPRPIPKNNGPGLPGSNPARPEATDAKNGDRFTHLAYHYKCHKELENRVPYRIKNHT